MLVAQYLASIQKQKKMRKISVIMPAYNAERWIARAILSLQHQTYSNWELCVVDDASTDNTIQVIKGFMKDDKRIKLERNETNLGCGLTRRKAIATAEGEYVAFLDSDDTFEPTFFEKMLEAIARTGADIAVCGTKEYENGIYKRSDICDETYCTRKKELYYQYMNGSWITQYNCNKMFKKEIIDKHEYSDMRFCEDSCTTYKWLWEAENVVVIPERLFNYYKHENSNSNTKNTPLQKSYDTCRCAWEHFKFCKEQGFEDMLPRLSMFVYEHLVRCINGFDIDTEEYNLIDGYRNEFLKHFRL